MKPTMKQTLIPNLSTVLYVSMFTCTKDLLDGLSVSEVPLCASLGKVSCRLGGAVGLSSLELGPSTGLIKVIGAIDCNIVFV